MNLFPVLPSIAQHFAQASSAGSVSHDLQNYTRVISHNQNSIILIYCNLFCGVQLLILQKADTCRLDDLNISEFTL